MDMSCPCGSESVLAKLPELGRCGSESVLAKLPELGRCVAEQMEENSLRWAQQQAERREAPGRTGYCDIYYNLRS